MKYMGKQLTADYQSENNGVLYEYLNKNNVNTVTLPSVQ